MTHAMDNVSIQLSLTAYDANIPNQQPGGASPSEKFKCLKLDRLLANNPLWNKLFITACVIAVSLDPLFVYIPFIDQDNKCLGMDKKLKNVSLVLRLLTDLIFVVHIIHQIRQAIKSKSEAMAVARKLSWRSMVTDILAVLPIPQVLLVGVFFKMRGSGYLQKIKVLNFFLLAQYLPRIYRIHLYSKNLSQTGMWAKGAFNFFLYILASHVLGAFWYFFSIQREISCWHQAGVSTFYCDDLSTTPRDITLFLDEFCPINVPANTTPPFDFGIFLASLQSENTASLNFSSKFLYSFWWGLRNLSNFGTNLTTSTYGWENLFAILISIIGLLLFLYLIGNVQTFMQLATTMSEKEIRRMIKTKEQPIEDWMVKHDLPDDLKQEIKKNIKQKLRENKDAIGNLFSIENMFSILSLSTKKPLKRFLCMKSLRTVPMFKEMDAEVLKMICDYLRPVMYDENSIVVRTGELLDRMIFITDGIIRTYVGGDQSRHGAGSSLGSQSSSMRTNTFNKGLFYGEELLYRASSQSQLPISAQTVQCHTKVEAFVLLAKDLESIVSTCATTNSKVIRWKIKMKEREIEEWMEKHDLPEDLKKEIKKNIKQKLKENKDADLENLFSILPRYTMEPLKRFLFMNTLRTVPMLKEMDEKVLKVICDYLRPVMYDENSIVVRTGELLDRMIFITEGFIWTYVGGDQSRHGGRSSSGSQSSSMPTNTLKKGEFYGEELLYRASSPSQLPISAQTVQCHTKVEAFVLMAKDLTSIVSKCALWWDSNNMNHSNNNNINVTHHGQPLLSGVESSTGSTPRIRYLKPAVRPH